MVLLLLNRTRLYSACFVLAYCVGGGGGVVFMSLIHQCWATCVTLTGGIMVIDMCSDGTSVAVL